MVNIFLRAMSPKRFHSYSCFFLEAGVSPFLGKDRHKWKIFKTNVFIACYHFFFGVVYVLSKILENGNTCCSRSVKKDYCSPAAASFVCFNFIINIEAFYIDSEYIYFSKEIKNCCWNILERLNTSIWEKRTFQVLKVYAWRHFFVLKELLQEHVRLTACQFKNHPENLGKTAEKVYLVFE